MLSKVYHCPGRIWGCEPSHQEEMALISLLEVSSKLEAHAFSVVKT
jgi:hypothetical protein